MAAHAELPLSPYGDSVRPHAVVLLAHPHEGMLDLVHYRNHADDPARSSLSAPTPTECGRQCVPRSRACSPITDSTMSRSSAPRSHRSSPQEARAVTDKSRPSSRPYAPECVEVEFCELRHNGVLRS
jgi:hypothetical protein